MRLVNQAVSFGMTIDVPQNAFGRAGALHAGHGRVEPPRRLRMTEPGVMPVEDRVRVDVQHVRVWYNSDPLKRILHFVLIAVLTIGLLAYFVWNSNPRVVWQIIRSADPLWLIAALFVNWCAVWFRTFRWRTILDPDHPP